MRRIFTNAVILTMVNNNEPITNGALGIEDNRIVFVGPAPSKQELSLYDEVIDCSGKAILPGFINTHNHVAMSLLRGYADDLPLKNWLEEEIWPIESKFESEQVKAGAMLSILEMIQSGTTCFLDMYDFMENVAEAVLESGIRACLCRGVICFDSNQEQQKLNDAVNFSKKWNKQGNECITTMLSPHSAYTCSPELITKFVEKAKELNLPLHTHMSETVLEVEQNITNYGVRPVEHLRRLGFFDVPALVAHAVHLTDEEIDILAKYDVKIAHNPGSNLKLGSGVSPIPKMLQKGMRPSVATDGPASNNNLDLLEEINLAALIHKGFTHDPKVVSAKTALKMGTIYGAEALFLEKEIGTLEVGKKADFITMDLTATHMQPIHNIESNIVYSACRSDIIDVFINGKEIMRNRECLHLDKEKIIFDANKAISCITV